MKIFPLKIISLIVWAGVWINSSFAQQAAYPEIYPPLPFDFAKSIEMGNTKTTVWYGRYSKVEGDESGIIWTTPIIESYQYERYEYFGSQMQMVSQYRDNGDKIKTEEYFYKNNLLSATEKLSYDSLQNSKKAGGFVYLYYKDGSPFQKVTLFGFPNKYVRVLDDFTFDENKKVVRQKSTAIGYGPDMDSLLNGRKDRDVITIVHNYKDSIKTSKKFAGLYKMQEESTTIYDENQLPKKTTVRNMAGDVILVIDFEYSEGNCSKKVYWTMNSGLEGEKELEIYKQEYFTYEEGLISTHIIEEKDIQTVFEYTHLTE